MKNLVSIVVVLSLALCVQSAIEYGHCRFQGVVDKSISGWVRFKGVNATHVEMTVNVSGIATNADTMHGIHIHQYGDLSDTTAGSSVASHWNPMAQVHSCPENGSVRHLGDTGNWQATGGVINSVKVLDLLSMTGYNSMIGFAVVLHGGTDDCVTVPSSGQRLAFCVVGVGNPNLLPLGQNDTVNNAVPGQVNITAAICNLMATGVSNTTVTGTIYFWQNLTSGLTEIFANISGINGSHGFHVHEWGDLSANDATSSGLHFNPHGVAHAFPTKSVRHVGDMGNIYFQATDGFTYYHFINDLMSLNAGLNDIVGRAVVVHAGSDNCTGTTGFAGSRLAHCIIGYANATKPVLAIDAATPTTQDDSSCPAAATTAATVATSTTGATVATSGSTTAADDDSSIAVTLGAALPLLFAIVIAIFSF